MENRKVLFDLLDVTDNAVSKIMQRGPRDGLMLVNVKEQEENNRDILRASKIRDLECATDANTEVHTCKSDVSFGENGYKAACTVPEHCGNESRETSKSQLGVAQDPKQVQIENIVVPEKSHHKVHSYVSVVNRRTLDHAAVGKESSESSDSSLTVVNNKNQSPNDKVKPGVFVSSYIMDHGSEHLKDGSVIKDQTQMESTLKEKSPNAKVPRKKQVSRTLCQGAAHLEPVVASEGLNGDVVATKFDPHLKKGSFMDKLKQHAGKGTSKKIVKAVLIPREEHKETQVVKPVQDEQPVDSVSLASLSKMTSAALGPFLQIQNALEGQISSLVNTIKSANAAGRDIHRSQQEDRIFKLESQLADLKKQKTEQYESQRMDLNTKEYQLDSDHRIEHEKENHISRLEQNRPNSQSAPLNVNPSERRAALKHNALTREIRDRENRMSTAGGVKRVAFVDSSAPPSPVRPTMLHPDSSSSQSSLMSDSSLLETPLPRHRIPVPVVKGTSTSHLRKSSNQKRKTHGKGVDILRDMLKNSPNEKENRYRVASSPLTKTDDHRESVPVKYSTSDDIFREDDKAGDLKALRKEMRDIIKGTEFLKKKLSDIHADIEDGGSAITKPRKDLEPLMPSSLLDTQLQTYPIKENKDQVPAEKILNAQGHGEDPYHYLTAATVLQDVAESRKRLERNLESMIRTREQYRLYEMLEQQSSGTSDEVGMLRRKIDKKIKQISEEVEKELADDKRKEPQPPKFGAIKNYKSIKSVNGQRQLSKEKNASSTAKSVQGKGSRNGSSSSQRRKPKTDIKDQHIVPVANRLHTVVRPPHIGRSYKTSVYGPPPYFPHRTTTRTVFPHQVPESLAEHHIDKDVEFNVTAVKPKTSSSTKKHNKYYFQRDPDLEGPALQDESMLLHGNLVPVAIPLGKPRQDVSLRLPLPSFDATKLKEEDASKDAVNVVCLEKEARLDNNVGIFTIDASEKDGTGKTLKTSKRKKKKALLHVQKIPSIDIESSSDISIITEQHTEKEDDKSIIPIPPPTKEDYDEFENFLCVRDVIGQKDEQENKDEKKTISMAGGAELPEAPYNGPSFPPKQPSTRSVNESRWKQDRPLEDRVTELIEQDLLARIVSQINSAPPDPALLGDTETIRGGIHQENEDSDSDFHTDTKDWIDALLGLQGLQLFIDAGIPVNQDLIQDLVKDTINEKLDILFGFPKRDTAVNADATPSAPSRGDDELERTPLSTPSKTPVYTPPESEANSEIKTPAISSPESSTADKSEILQFAKHSQDDNQTVEEIEGSVDVVETPPKTPSWEELSKDVTREPRVGTPTTSLSDRDQGTRLPISIPTPEQSVEEPEQLDEDFVLTEESTKSTHMTKEELFIPSLPEEKPESVKSSFPSVKQLKSSESSISSATYTLNSSTPQSSALARISEGELVNQTQSASGPYSEGEFPVSPGQLPPVVQLDTNNQGKDHKEDVRILLRDLADKKVTDSEGTGKLQSTLSASPANTLKDTEDIDEDSISCVSKSDGELSLRDPVFKLLTRINTPPDVYRIATQTRYTNSEQKASNERSEGEISVGEDYQTKRQGDKEAIRTPLQILSEASAGSSVELSPGEVASSQIALSQLDLTGIARAGQDRMDQVPKQYRQEAETSREEESAIVNNKVLKKDESVVGLNLGKTTEPRSPEEKTKDDASNVRTVTKPRFITVAGKGENAEASTENISWKDKEKTRLMLTIPSADEAHGEQSDNSIRDVVETSLIEDNSVEDVSSISEGQI